ncbi:MAG: carbon monoxide dehydrogenase subunit G [Rhodoferax sp.]|nr:carbon monoxide dehydrogenase subunit G [Rhodoferax sp.]
MEFLGEYRIAARQQQVWDALNNPAVLQACIAGCSRLEKISDTEMLATVVAAVGPISTTFKGTLVLSEVNAPHGYTLTGQGQGGAAGFARMQAQVSLTEDESDTVLRYVANAEIGGKLANVGSRLVQTVAKKNADDFFAAFARHMRGPEDQTQAATEAIPTTVAAQQPAKAPSNLGLLSSLAAPVPAWLVVFACGLGFALGYCVARLA